MHVASFSLVQFRLNLVRFVSWDMCGGTVPIGFPSTLDIINYKAYCRPYLQNSELCKVKQLWWKLVEVKVS